MGKVAFYIGHGVEVRHYLISGLLDAVRETKSVVLVVDEQLESNTLKEYLVFYKVPILRMPKLVNSKPSFFIEGVIRAIRDARKRHKKIGIYRHFGEVGNGNCFLDFVKGNRVLHYLNDIIGRKWTLTRYFNRELFVFFTFNKVDCIYLLEFGSTNSKAIGSVCAKKGIQVNLFLNTLKTVFINDFIPFPINRINVWNDQQKNLFISANPAIAKKKIVATGTPFHFFLRKNDFEYLRLVKLKYNICSGRPIIVYSLLYEKVYSNEHLIIEKINGFFNQKFRPEERPIIVLRRNPFEESDFGIKYLSQFSDIVFADQYWERNSEKGWSIQGLEGELEWRALLDLATITMNIPSMSTVDSLMCGTPVVNIGFDETGYENKSISHIIHSPFVNEFAKSEFVSTFTDFDLFKESFRHLLGIKSVNSRFDIQNSIDVVKMDINQYIS